jgi:aryl-alcohol dehydrogenase-like predicted oxidoreductase
VRSCNAAAEVDQIFNVVTARPLEIEARPLRNALIPRVALGCGNFGGIGSSLAWVGHGQSEDEALAIMDAAWELGLTHFDTADAYGAGNSESAIGRWIASRGIRPTLTTKTFNPMAEGADSGLGAKRIERQFQSSLERLGVDHVELYLAHDYDPDTPLPETLGAFQALEDAGSISAYGVSNFNAEQLERARAAGDPVAVQNGYSLLERGDEAEVLPLCAKHGISYMVFSPLCGGWLTGKYGRDHGFPSGSRMTQRPEPYEHLLNEPTFDALDALRAFGDRRGTSMAGVALAWLLADDRVGQVVIGPGRPAHLDPLREAIEQPLTPVERDEVGSIFQP